MLEKKEPTTRVRIPQSLKGIPLAPNQLSTSSWKRIVANKIKQISSEDNPYQRGKKMAEKNIKDGSSQGYIPVRDIKDGLIITVDGRYVDIVEVLPVNYNNMKQNKQDMVEDKFGSLFKDILRNCMIKIMSDPSDPSDLIESIYSNCRNQQKEEIRESLFDYARHVSMKAANGTVIKRYFIVFEYMGDDKGRKSSDFEVIKSSMFETRHMITNTLLSCGNLCITPNTPEEATHNIEAIQYRFFNRKTALMENYNLRKKRIQADFEKFNSLTGMNKKMLPQDCFGPKGLYFTNRSYMQMDGTYYTFLGVKGKSWVNMVPGGWIDFFDMGVSVDVDILIRRLPKELTMLAIKNYNRLTKGISNELSQRGMAESAENSASTFSNNDYIYQSMKKTDQQLYDVGIILTIRADNVKTLMSNASLVKKYLNKEGFKVDDSYLWVEDYFNMTMPYMNFTPPFRTLKHNVLSSDMGSLFPFTSYRIYDKEGFYLGNDSNNCITVLNNFNTKMFKNANIALFGTPGAGKTFTEQHMAYGLLLNGVRCYSIIPKKGYEYYNGCMNVGGTYVSLVPGSKDCVNILEIRPMGEMDESLLGEDTFIPRSGSLLAKKINDVVIWLSLLIDKPMNVEELNRAKILLKEMYTRYGITDDDKSIFAEDGRTLKVMPIIEDMYNLFSTDGRLRYICAALEDFVHGSCSNMNGQTNVDLDNDYIVYNVDEDMIGERLLPSFLFIAFSHSYQMIQENQNVKGAMILDEVWKMMKTEECAKQVQNAVKIVRGFGGCTIIGTQEINDLINEPTGMGRSIISCSEISLFLNMKESDLLLLKDIYNFPPDVYEEILGVQKGTGMLYANGDKTIVKIEASQREYDAFTTDVNDRIRKVKVNAG